VPTLRDVAILAGVSTATVSHVVNNSRRTSPETRARVEKAIAQIGFVPNPVGRLLALQKSGVAIQPSDLTDLANHTNNQAISLDPDYEVPTTTSVGISNDTVRAVLKIIRAAQPISKTDLAKRLDIKRSTLTSIIKPLLSSNIIRETELEHNQSTGNGKPNSVLSLVANNNYFIGINIGVRRTQIGIATIDEQMLAEESFDTTPDPESTLSHVRSIMERLIDRFSDRKLTLIGVSVPSPTDSERTKILYAPHLGWRDIDVKKALQIKDKNRQDIPIIVENDALAAATYEARLRLRDCTDGTWNDFVLVRAGTGIGVGLVLGGEVYRGTGEGGGLASEFGHMTIVAGGKPCVCGNRGCWERYASASSAASLYNGDRPVMKGMTTLRFTDIVNRAEAGELRAQRTLERIGEHLGIGIGNVMGGVGISRIVVSGRVVYGWKFIEKSLREAVARSIVGRLTQWSIVAGQPTGAGLGGAIEVAIEEHLTELANAA
jgi:predicted NBD/HSP70 family sugar kinase